jgi:hypothetical protein
LIDPLPERDLVRRNVGAVITALEQPAQLFARV